mgnify:CR=1 FL=1
MQLDRGDVAAAVSHLLEFNDIILRGARRDAGMPQWDDVFSEEDADALHAYLIDLSWQAYSAQQADEELQEEMKAGPAAH